MDHPQILATVETPPTTEAAVVLVAVVAAMEAMATRAL